MLNPSEHKWLSDKYVRTLFKAFPKDSLRFVGGCVRNALLGEAIGDIDLATQLTPNEMIAALEAANIRYVKTGIAHGTITAIIDGTPFEVTTLRRDVETDGRRAVVAFTTDWAEDAQRRDLTINALYADDTGEVFDPTGEGINDIKAGRLRFVGDAGERIREDYLRLLRFFRFAAWYGADKALDKEALSAARELKSGIKSLSAERVWSEIKKLLLAPNPSRIIRIMAQQGILDVILPEASNSEGLALYIELEKSEGFLIDPLMRLMSMAARDPLSIARLCKRLKLSNKESARLRCWAEDDTVLTPSIEPKELRAAIYKSGMQTISDRIKVRAAGELDPILRGAWIVLLEIANDWDEPEFPISGKDLMALNIPSGPQMGRVMKALEALWIRSDFKVGKEGLLAAANIFKGQ